MRNFLLLTMTLILLAGCSAPFRITDRPTYGAIDQIKNKYQPQDKIKLVIDQKTKELRLTKGPSDLVGAATAYDFNIGEAFSGHLTELFNSVFINTTNSPLTVNVKIDSCNISYANAMVHILAWSEIDMAITTTFYAADKQIKMSTSQYHSRIDIPFSERVYGAPPDRAVVTAIDEIIDQLLSDILKNKSIFQPTTNRTITEG